jgi:hypothetical protein
MNMAWEKLPAFGSIIGETKRRLPCMQGVFRSEFWDSWSSV